jgi:hypothetical protein
MHSLAAKGAAETAAAKRCVRVHKPKGCTILGEPTRESDYLLRRDAPLPEIGTSPQPGHEAFASAQAA